MVLHKKKMPCYTYYLTYPHYLRLLFLICWNLPGIYRIYEVYLGFTWIYECDKDFVTKLWIYTDLSKLLFIWLEVIKQKKILTVMFLFYEYKIN